jgi:hypothetical protein
MLHPLYVFFDASSLFAFRIPFEGKQVNHNFILLQAMTIGYPVAMSSLALSNYIEREEASG